MRWQQFALGAVFLTCVLLSSVALSLWIHQYVRGCDTMCHVECLWVEGWWR